jgi:hypothetical protein
VTRGKVLGLTLDQVAARARYLASPQCVAGYYRLNGEKDGLPPYNGGKDPTAPDPFDRWVKPGGKNTNITADCIGGAAWCGGFDRYQPERFAHLYDGWINTDSMLMDAKGKAKCFVLLDRPTIGAFVVCPTKSPGHPKAGHIGTIIGVPAEWDPEIVECWRALRVVDVASRGASRANIETTGAGWYQARVQGGFVRSVMTP